MDIAGFIEETNRASSSEALFDQFQRTTEKLGFTRCLFAGGSTDPQFRERYGIRSPTPIILNSYPSHWTSHYQANHYISIDPVFARVRSKWDPLIWDTIPANTLGKAERRLMNEADESGLRNGMSVPLHGPDGDSFVMSLASDYTGQLGLIQHLPYVRIMCAQFFLTFTDLWRAVHSVPRAVPSLTRRERECLQWATHGKSAWEIGIILHISEATVRFHLSNSFTKLGAQNRINAIVRAVRWGIVTL